MGFYKKHFAILRYIIEIMRIKYISLYQHAVCIYAEVEINEFILRNICRFRCLLQSNIAVAISIQTLEQQQHSQTHIMSISNDAFYNFCNGTSIWFRCNQNLYLNWMITAFLLELNIYSTFEILWCLVGACESAYFMTYFIIICTGTSDCNCELRMPTK